MKNTAGRGQIGALVLSLLGFAGVHATSMHAQAEPIPGSPWVVGGDITGNGSVNVVDALCAMIGVLSDTCGVGPTPSCLIGPTSYVDFNCDAACNVLDVQLAVVLATGAPLGAGDTNASGVPDACEQPECSGGEVLCDGICVDTSSDDAHCGGCNTPCSGGATCVGGACQVSSGFCDWKRDVPCVPAACGACSTDTPGYRYVGVHNGQHCWWHTHNQNWNTTTATNYYELATAFGLNPATGTASWCHALSETPNPPLASTAYNGAGNIGAWGCCDGYPSSGGFVCFADNGSPGGPCD